MAAIVPETVYTKTAKGILEARNKSAKLPKELAAVFQAIDGKATVGEIQPRIGVATPQLHQALNTLVTDGYIKTVATASQPAAAITPPAPAADVVEFGSGAGLSHLNMEAASHALAEAEATKHAQQQARTALDARLRAEAEARARSLAEVRAQAEAEARAKAEAAANVAAEERAQAEREAAAANDPAARAAAENRARAAGAAAVRAQAEARARTEAEARALALVEEKRIAEERAREEVLAHEKDQGEAQARASSEARARQAVEAKMQAMADPHGQPDNTVASGGRSAASLGDVPAAPSAASSTAAPSAAPTPSPADVPSHEWQAEPDFSDLAQRLTARVTAERRARDEAERKHRDAFEAPAAADAEQPRAAPDDFPALQLSTSEAAAPAAPAPPEPTPRAPELPSLSLSPVSEPSDMKHTTPDHVPSALERAMMQTAARAEAEEEQKQEKKQSAAELSAAKTAPHVVNLRVPAEDEPSDTPEPTLEDEPVHERLNVDRTAHDVIAESAEARRRAEAAQLARSAAAARRQRSEDDARRAAKAERAGTRKRASRAVLAALMAVPVLAVLFLQFVPLNGYIPQVQQALSQRLNQPTTISTLHYVLLPSPRLVLEGVRIGSAQDVHIDRVDAYAWPTTVMADPKVFDRVDVTGVTIDQAMLAAVPSWTGGRSASSVHVARLKLADVKLSIPESGLEGLAGDVTFEPNGTIKQAALGNEKLKIELTPQQTGLRVVVNAQDWKAPFGPSVPFSFLSIDGVADKQHFGTTAFSGRIGGGTLTGTLAARWDGPFIVGGEFKLQGVKLDELMPQTVPDFKMRGTLVATGRYALQSDSASGVLGRPLVEASFSITRGELSNIDLVRAIQTAGSFRGGGRTAFDELTGTLHVNGKRYNYQQLQLSSGPLNVRGNVEATAGGPISGRVDAAFDARGTIARASFRVTGTVKEPQIVR